MALARFGDDAAWVAVRKRLEDEDPDARDAVVRALGHVREPRGVEILIARLEDDGFLYTTADGRIVVGHHAASSLATLSGRKFGRSKARWTAWWEDSDKRLPPRKGAGR